MKRILVPCGNAPVPLSLDEGSFDATQPLSHIGGKANVNLVIEAPESELLAQLDPRAGDLVRIASYVFAADQLTSRGGRADVFGQGWVRDFTVCLPVRDVDFWSGAEVGAALTDALRFISGDVWRFKFSRAKREEAQIPLTVDPSAVLGNPDEVMLFSGGADSLCATVEAAHLQGRKPLLVGHSPSFNVENRHVRLARHLRSMQGSPWLFPYIGAAIHRTQAPPRDDSQRTRAFLYGSIGSAYASCLGITRVSLADNGVVSLNLPINAQLLGATASRGTHPRFFSLYNQLLALVFPKGPRLENPLWDRTRAEGLRVLTEAGVPELVEETVSCSRPRYRPNAQPYCGSCSQCIDRRFATIAAGLEKFDPADRYEIDVFLDPLTRVEDRTVGLDYVRFAQGVEGRSFEDLFLQYSELAQCVIGNATEQRARAEAIADLLNRHARTVIGVVDDQLRQHSRRLAEGSLPITCLLRLVAAGQVAASLPPDDLPPQDNELAEAPPRDLSVQEEADVQLYGFRSRLPIEVTGTRRTRGRNLVRIGGMDVELPMAEFKLFLFLVYVALTSKDGWVREEELNTSLDAADDETIAPLMVSQAIHRLRLRLAPALRGLDAKEFIEASGFGQVRLSTHGAFITADWSRLSSHENPVVQRIARLAA